MSPPDWEGLIREFDRLTAQTHQALTALLAENDRLRAALKACASSAPDTVSISVPDGQASEPVVLENPAKQR